MPVMALPYDQGTLDRVRNGVSPAIVNNNNNNVNNNQNANNNQLINNVGNGNGNGNGGNNGGNDVQAINAAAPVAPQVIDPEYAYGAPAPSVGEATNAIENVNTNINNNQNVNNNQLINNNNVINGGAPAQPIIAPAPVEPVQPEPAEQVVSILPVPPIPAASEIAQDGGINTPATTTVLGADPPGVTGYDAVDITLNEFEIVEDGVPEAIVDVLDFVPLDGSQGLEEIIVSPVLPENVPVPIGTGVVDIVNATAPNNIVPVFQNSTLPTSTQPAMPLFTNGTGGFATPTLGGLATGTGLSTAVATISGIIGITNLTENATAQAYPCPGANPYNPSVEGQLYKRAPMPPLTPHVPSYLANQDAQPEMSRLNSIGVSVHEWVKRAVEATHQGIQGTNGKEEVRDGNGQPAGQSFMQQHLGVFLCALAGVIMLMGGMWYMGKGVKGRKSAVEEIGEQEEGYKEKVQLKGKPWYTRFGFKRHDQPVPYAGQIGSFNDANTAEEGGLRAAMGGDWNSNGARGSWETQRTAPPAYRGEEGLTDEKNPRGEEFSNARFV